MAPTRPCPSTLASRTSVEVTLGEVTAQSGSSPPSIPSPTLLQVSSVSAPCLFDCLRPRAFPPVPTLLTVSPKHRLLDLRPLAVKNVGSKRCNLYFGLYLHYGSHWSCLCDEVVAGTYLEVGFGHRTGCESLSHTNIWRRGQPEPFEVVSAAVAIVALLMTTAEECW